ncbi:MAG: hypothetical protein CL525_00315 [Aequorivita sp.]|nr:hypothetical protein [Aequorivita sp.]|tara:strand:+ start:3308 stop:3577 length:270 start_codon:yes stop_codon:yes gene_type:complete
MDITITITDTEAKCLDRICIDKSVWIHNAAIARAYKESKEIRRILMEHCNANDIAMAVGEAAQVSQAFELGIVETAAKSIEKAESEKPK